MMTLFEPECIFKNYVETEVRYARQEGRDEGRNEGILEGRIEGTVRVCKDMSLSVSDTVQKIVSLYGLSKEDAESKVKEYWQ
jgi:predicted transposase YdaD